MTRRFRHALFVLLLLVTVMAAPAAAQDRASKDWPMSRGGNYNRGDAAPKKDNLSLEPIWEYVAVAGVTAEPVAANGVVYFHDMASVVHAVDIKTGKRIWASKPRVSKTSRAEVDPRALGDLSDIGNQASSANRCSFSAPLVVGELLVSATESGVITAFRLGDGKVMWERDIETKIFSSPRAFEGRLLLGALDAKFRAIDLKTGKDVWVHECGDIIGSTPAITRSGKIYLLSNDKVLTVLDARTGKVKKTMEVGYRSNSHLCFAEATLFFVSTGRRFTAFDVISGKTRWYAENPSSTHLQSAVYRDGKVYVHMGPSLRCYRTSDGLKIWETPLGETGGFTPTIGKDHLYLRTKGALRIFDMKTGKQASQINIPNPSLAPVLLVDGRVIFADGAGVVRAL